MLSVKKRDGRIVPFNREKIYNAIKKAMNMSGKISETVAHKIGEEIYTKHANENIPINISEIETDVFNLLIKHGKKEVAKLYEGYRSIREFQRKSSNNIESQVSELLDGKSDYWNNENSNKNQNLVTTQRDYMAGIVSTNISRKYLLPPDIIQAHDEGILHFHKQHCGIAA